VASETHLWNAETEVTTVDQSTDVKLQRLDPALCCVVAQASSAARSLASLSKPNQPPVIQALNERERYDD
jgi:hypothetical protein